MPRIDRRVAAALCNDPCGRQHGMPDYVLRNRYRSVYLPLRAAGVEQAQRFVVHLVVHGHRNRTEVQRLEPRQGMMHLTCDVTQNCDSRRVEGLDGIDAGVTLIHPDGCVVGLGSDCPDAKWFEPAAALRQETRCSHAA